MSDIKKLTLLTRALIIFLILPLHEYAHAWTARKLGDDTATYQGRLTLNPIAHIDPLGAILLFMTGFGWAKPVPIDPLRFKRKYSIRKGMAITAAAGPISNLIAALVAMIGYRFYYISSYFNDGWIQYKIENSLNTPVIIYYFLTSFISINIGLALFNLIPIPPLDGSKVLYYFLGTKGGKVSDWLTQNQQVVSIIFILLVYSPLLNVPLSFLRNHVFDGMWFITDWIPKLFG